MNVYDIVKLKSDPPYFGQIISDGQDHEKHAKLNLEAQLTVRRKNGDVERVELKEIDTVITNEEILTFKHDNPYLL